MEIFSAQHSPSLLWAQFSTSHSMKVLSQEFFAIPIVSVEGEKLSQQVSQQSQALSPPTWISPRAQLVSQLNAHVFAVHLI